MAKFSIKKRLETHPPNRKTVDQIKEEIRVYIESKYSLIRRLLGVPFDDWYVGITHDDDERTQGHKSSKKIKDLKHFKSWQAKSVSNARTVEMELCNEFDLDSCAVAGGITVKSKRVYVYNLAKSERK